MSEKTMSPKSSYKKQKCEASANVTPATSSKKDCYEITSRSGDG